MAAPNIDKWEKIRSGQVSSGNKVLDKILADMVEDLMTGTFPIGSIGTTEIADNAVTEDKVSDSVLTGVIIHVADLAGAQGLTEAQLGANRVVHVKSLGFYRVNLTSGRTADNVEVITPTVWIGGNKRLERFAEDIYGIRLVDSVYDLANLDVAYLRGTRPFFVRYTDQINTLLDTITAGITGNFIAHIALGIGAAHPGGPDAVNTIALNGGQNAWTTESPTPRWTQLNSIRLALLAHAAAVPTHGSAGTVVLPAAITSVNDIVGEWLLANALIAQMAAHFPDVTGAPAVHDLADNANVPVVPPVGAANAQTATEYHGVFVYNEESTVLGAQKALRPVGTAAADPGRFEEVCSALETTVDRTDLAYLRGYGIESKFIDMTVNPTDGDTATIGGDVYEFVDTAVNTIVNLDTHIAVQIGVAAANTRANWLAAINGTADIAHATITLADGVTPALGRGTEPVFGMDDGAGIIHVFPSPRVGRDPRLLTYIELFYWVGTLPSVALAATLTSTEVWSGADLDECAFYNPAITRRSVFSFTRAITADDITAGLLVVHLPYIDPAEDITVHVTVLTAGNVMKVPALDSFVLAAGVLTITLPGGVGDLVAGDVIHVTLLGVAP